MGKKLKSHLFDGIALVLMVVLSAAGGWALAKQWAEEPVTGRPETMAAPALVDLEPVEEIWTEPSADPLSESERITYRPEVPLTDDLQAHMIRMCVRYDVPYALALAVAEQESSFDPNARSATGDVGLMQINRINFDDLNARGIDPETVEGNIEAGVSMLGDLIDRYGDYGQALMAYNLGPTGMTRLWDQGIYSTAYSRTVLNKYERWELILD